MEQVRLLAEAIELEVDLDPVAHSSELGHEPIVPGDPDAVRVEDDPGDVPFGGRPDDLDDLGVDRRLAAGQHQRIDLPAFAGDRRVEGVDQVADLGVTIDARTADREAGRALEVAVLGDVEQEDARVLRLQVAEAVQVAHRDRPSIAGAIGHDLAGRDAPLLEVLPEADVLLVQAHHLAVAAPADPAQLDLPVHRDEVALEDVGLVVDLSIRILREAAAADRQDHPERGIRAQREHRTLRSVRT